MTDRQRAETAAPEQDLATRIQRLENSVEVLAHVLGLNPRCSPREQTSEKHQTKKPKTPETVEIIQDQHLRVDGEDFPWFVLGVTAETSPDHVSTIQVTIPVESFTSEVGTHGTGGHRNQTIRQPHARREVAKRLKNVSPAELQESDWEYVKFLLSL